MDEKIHSLPSKHLINNNIPN